MMQQVATAKQDIAASTLPFEAPETQNRESGAQFGQVLNNESRGYNDRQRNDNSSSVVRDKQYQAAKERSENARNEDLRSESHQLTRSQKDHALSKSTDRAQPSSAQASQADNQVDNQAESQAASSNTPQQAETNASARSENSASRSDSSVEQTAQSDANKADELASSEAAQAQAGAGDQVKQDDFDWVSFVSQVKVMSEGAHASTEANEQAQLQDSEGLSEDFFTQIMQSEAGDSANQMTGDITEQTIVDSDTDTELMIINVAVSDLVAMLQAKAANTDSAAASDADAQASMDTAISAILEQLSVQQSESDTPASSSEEQDIALLRSMLIGLDQADTGNESNNSELPMLSLEQEAALLEASLQAEATVQAGLDGNANLSAAVTPQPSVAVAVNKDNSANGINSLLALPDADLEEVLSNVSERVKQSVPALGNEAKGQEFIAALQSGVKELKEQLKQGREPGIDLKALVNDALAASDIAVTAQVETKIDVQLNQVNNILCLANSITQTTSQLQASASSFALGDIQLQKETMQAQLENKQQFQQNAANNDKAMNIFKPEGQQQLVEKVRWMIGSKNMTADIRLDPPDLGGLNIKVSMSGDAASVSFTVQSQQTRDALDQATPRLREMLEEQGIQLGQSSVEQDSNQQSQEFGEAGSGSQNNASGMQDSEEDLAQDTQVLEQRVAGGTIGGIDYYV